MHTIIETSAGQLFRVRETGDATTAHVWLGIAVKRAAGGFVPKVGAKEILVRKAATKLVAEIA